MSEITPEEQHEWARKYREAVRPHLGGEEVEAVGEFERPMAWWQGTGDAALIVHLISRPFAKDARGRLGDLPERFLLAVTRDKVYAFKYYLKKGSELDVKGPIADFDRESISFSQEMGTWAGVAVLELTEDGQHGRIQIKGDLLDTKKNPWGAEVLAALKR